MLTSFYIFILTATKKAIAVSSLFVIIPAALVRFTPEVTQHISSLLYILIGGGISLGAFSLGILLSRSFEEDLTTDGLTDIFYPITKDEINQEIKRKKERLSQFEKSIIHGGRLNNKALQPNHLFFSQVPISQ